MKIEAQTKVGVDQDLAFLTWVVKEIAEGRMRITFAIAESRGVWFEAKPVEPQ